MGTLQSQVFSSSGTFVFPSGVSAAWAMSTAAGGGGGGGGQPGFHEGGGGGGGGECAVNQMIYDDGTHQFSVTVPTGGTAGTTSEFGGAGGDSVFGPFRCNGGNGGTSNGVAGDGIHQNSSGAAGGAMGGGPLGWVNISGGLGMVFGKAGPGGGHDASGTYGLPSGPKNFAGPGGGGSDENNAGASGASFAPGVKGAGGSNTFDGTFFDGGGGGGGASIMGNGGGGDSGYTGPAGSAPGLGGGGGGSGVGHSTTGHAGGNGQVIIFWIG